MSEFPDEDLRTAGEYNDACPVASVDFQREYIYITWTLVDSHRSPLTAPVFCYL